MTGTSIDALDTSLVEIDGHGLTMRARPVRNITKGLGDLAPRLRALAEQQPMTAGQIAALSRDFALLHADTLHELLGGEKPDLVCVHGQTVFHQPPLSWQLMQPAPIAQAVRCPVVYDLRQADLAAGGQGAPITPIADWVLFGDLHRATAVVNLGGFCNVTLLPAPGTELAPKPNWTAYTPTSTHVDMAPVVTSRERRDLAREAGEVRAQDVCTCNQLLDEIARRLFRVPFDSNGDRALRGTLHADAVEDLEGVLLAQAASCRSLGTGDELAEWISRFRNQVTPEDLAASACEAIATVIVQRVQQCSNVLLAGGGVRNAALVRAITSCCSARVTTTSEHGVAPEYREAICFAVLGALCQDKVPITIPAVTGVKQAPLSGAWVYP